MADAEEKARLLRILEGHGQSFLSSFELPNLGDSSKKRKADKTESTSNKKSKREEEEIDGSEQSQDDDEEEEEEWLGIGHDRDEADSCSEDSEEDGDEDGSDFEHSDSEFTSAPQVDSKVVVFADPSAKKSEVDDMSRVQMKAFMSSKISKLSSNSQDPKVMKKNKEEEEEDRTNAQNDALLHKLVHTKLLSGSLDPDLDLTPAQRRKALAGRVLELTGTAKLGKGEKQVRDAEKRKASKQVREGLSAKQKQREVQQLEEAKNLGNYHPILKKAFEASGGATTRKREKGLKMGVGNFKNGSLRLSRDDVNMALGGGFGGGPSRGGRGGRGRGGGSGRGKRK